MTSSRKIFVLGGLALAVLGIAYGLWYAVAVEHQTLDSLGGALTGAFQAAEQHDAAGTASMLARYRQTKYAYERQVDVHSHIIGLAILLIVFGLASDRINFAEKTRSRLALALLTGSILFPLGVLMETTSHGPIPQALAAIGSAVVILALLGISVGFARPPIRS